ncbi:MAG: PLP-dependent transferase [Chitinophagaceae bacterium]|nr:PLP-dependent transferase [Chitinophagaceae bacterium]
MLGSDIEQNETRITKIYLNTGGNANAFDAFLLIQGMKTLEVSMERHWPRCNGSCKLLREPMMLFQSKLHRTDKSPGSLHCNETNAAPGSYAEF